MHNLNHAANIQLRFSEKFNYTIEVDDEIDLQSYVIPPMLLQPYVENAIWHGLRYKEDKGKLSIVFKKKDNNTITICIFHIFISNTYIIFTDHIFDQLIIHN